MPTPYAEHVGSHDPIDVLRSSLDDYRALMHRFSADTWARAWAEGKWTARQVMVHVSQWEMIFGTRVRSGLGLPGYVVQMMEQDNLMGEANVVDGPTAFAAFDGMRRMNLALAQSLTPAERTRTFQHPERGTIDVNDVLVTLAGHGVHHFKQLKTMA